MHITSKYLDEEFTPVLGEYEDGSTSLRGISPIGEPLFKATVNLADYGVHPEDGNVFIKTYSENEGLYDGLLSAGVIGPAVHNFYVENGNVVKECPLLIERKDYAE